MQAITHDDAAAAIATLAKFFLDEAQEALDAIRAGSLAKKQANDAYWRLRDVGQKISGLITRLNLPEEPLEPLKTLEFKLYTVIKHRY